VKNLGDDLPVSPRFFFSILSALVPKPAVDRTTFGFEEFAYGPPLGS
jgi:hypothetical protein